MGKSEGEAQQDKAPSRDADAQKLGMQTAITRRDFVGGTLLGAGAALLGMASPAVLKAAAAPASSVRKTGMAGLDAGWTGPGGIGDYALSNGNTHAVVNAAHEGIRNLKFEEYLSSAIDSGETHDVVVVGAGISGLTAAYAYHKSRPDSPVLILDQHPAFGGEAKHNEFEVDGHRLWAPQGSGITSQSVDPNNPEGVDLGNGVNIKNLYSELGFPQRWEFQKATGLTNKDMLVGSMPWGAMHGYGDVADTGYFYPSKGWVINPWKGDFSGAPVSAKMRQDAHTWRNFANPPYREDWRQWMDSITVREYMTSVMGLGDEMIAHFDPVLGVTSGLGADVTSAYGAFSLMLWSQLEAEETRRTGRPSLPPPGHCASWSGLKQCPVASVTTGEYVTLPGGNAAVARQLVRKLIPGAYAGETLTDVVLGSLNWDTLDRPNQPVRLRLSSTVVAVTHDGDPGSSKGVVVHYTNGGKLYKARAKAAIVAGQQHSNKHICRDLPDEHRAAMDTFAHGPILTVNVALRNWKCMDKLGISAARWFEGFGWFTSINRTVLIDGKEPTSLDPSKPVVLTLYTGFGIPGMSYKEQAVAARMRLFSMSYADIEKSVREQFNTMFASVGFDAKRDIAGIITNRWGHAYAVEYPGFYFGKDGKPTASEVIRKRHGRIAFCHAELVGTQTWPGAAIEGSRAAAQVLEVV